MSTDWIFAFSPILQPSSITTFLPITVYAPISTLSWIFAVFFAYFTNKKYVFECNRKDKKEIIKFFLSRIGTLLLDMVIMYIFVSQLKFNDKVMKIISQVCVIVLNYVLSKFIVFKKS